MVNRKPPNKDDVIATTHAVFRVVLDGRSRVAMLADNRGSPILMRFEPLPRGWQKAPKMMVVRGDEALGILYLTIPKPPKGQSKVEWTPILQDWEDLADEVLQRTSLPKAHAFTYADSYLEGSEGTPEFRNKLEEWEAEFIVWIK